MPKHFVFVIGTRAQLIKVAPVIAACERRKLPSTLLMTGQHLETMQDLLDEFGIRSPQVHAVPAHEHSSIGSLLRWLPSAYRGVRERLRSISDRPADVDVLVHGDTLSTVVGAVAARRFGGRVIHLESGLTSGKVWDPFPEEISRRIVFRLADVAMCPSASATQHMRAHYKHCAAFNTQGNTILDAVSLVGVTRQARAASGPDYLVASLHRFQNIYDAARLTELVALFEAIARRYPIHFVLHPATRKRLVSAQLLDRLSSSPNIKLCPRLGYGAFLRLASAAACVLTDGGSNQEELAALGVPTIVMRKTTERGDGLGQNILLEKDVPGGVEAYLASGGFRALERSSRFAAHSPSEAIVQILADA